MCLFLVSRVLQSGYVCSLEGWESERRYEAKGYLYLYVDKELQSTRWTYGRYLYMGTGDLLSRGVLMSTASWVSHWPDFTFEKTARPSDPTASALSMAPLQTIEHALTFLRYIRHSTIFCIKCTRMMYEPSNVRDCRPTMISSEGHTFVEASPHCKAKTTLQSNCWYRLTKHLPTCHPCTSQHTLSTDVWAVSLLYATLDRPDMCRPTHHDQPL
jgi:hypothetical protein